MEFFQIVIDGTAGAGKGTVAHELARILSEQLHTEVLHIDTGALYRAVTVYFLENGLDIDDSERCIDSLPEINLEVKNIDGETHVLLNGGDVTSRIREDDVDKNTPKVAGIPAVRDKVHEILRTLAEKCNIVVDGRDMGTVVFPKARYKIFLVASTKEQARRRTLQKIAEGRRTTYEAEYAKINARDYNDLTRDIDPLDMATEETYGAGFGAAYLDTTKMTLEQVVEMLKTAILADLAEKFTGNERANS